LPSKGGWFLAIADDWLGQIQRTNIAYVYFVLSVPSIIGGLHHEPDSGSVSEYLAEPDCCGRRDRLLLAEDIIEMLARDIEGVSNFRLANLESRQNISRRSAPG
jgi:hypothetical protein